MLYNFGGILFCSHDDIWPNFFFYSKNYQEFVFIVMATSVKGECWVGIRNHFLYRKQEAGAALRSSWRGNNRISFVSGSLRNAKNFSLPILHSEIVFFDTFFRNSESLMHFLKFRNIRHWWDSNPLNSKQLWLERQRLNHSAIKTQLYDGVQNNLQTWYLLQTLTGG